MADLGDPHLRASDTERSAVAEELGAHFTEGRLDQNEFDQRLRLAMSAKTRGELSGLLADLPALPEPPPPVPKVPWWARSFGQRDRRLAILACLLVVVGVAIIATGHAWGTALLIVMAIMLGRLRRRRRYARWHAHMHEHGLSHAHEGLPVPGVHPLTPGHIGNANPGPVPSAYGVYPSTWQASPPQVPPPPQPGWPPPSQSGWAAPPQQPGWPPPAPQPGWAAPPSGPGWSSPPPEVPPPGWRPPPGAEEPPRPPAPEQ